MTSVHRALLSLATRQLEQTRHGQFQGVLASIVGQLVFSTIYFLVQNRWLGAVWLSVVIVYSAAVPLVLSLRLGSKIAGIGMTKPPSDLLSY